MIDKSSTLTVWKCAQEGMNRKVGKSFGALFGASEGVEMGSVGKIGGGGEAEVTMQLRFDTYKDENLRKYIDLVKDTNFI